MDPATAALQSCDGSGEINITALAKDHGVPMTTPLDGSFMTNLLWWSKIGKLGSVDTRAHPAGVLMTFLAT
jgi:hypothetical protein